jgi:hypothetical protein
MSSCRPTTTMPLSGSNRKRSLGGLAGEEAGRVIPVVKTTPWLDALKPIPVSSTEQSLIKKKKRGKKKKPVGMKAFFPALKNSQGFDMHLCRFESAIQDHVFVPKKYGDLSRNAGWRDLSFCRSCKLTPCLTVEHFDEIFAKAMEEHRLRKKLEIEGKKTGSRNDVELMKRIDGFCMKLMRKHFGKDCTA